MKAIAEIPVREQTAVRDRAGGGIRVTRDRRPARLKSIVGEADDQYEREAERVANLVTSTPPSAAMAKPVAAPGRVCAACAAEGKTSCSCAQRKAKAGASATTCGSPPARHRPLPGAGHALPAQTRESLEPRFGRDFSQVRVHHDGPAAAMARDFGADALTIGQHIIFGQGRFEPAGAPGLKLIAHELTHVVQQASSAGSPPPVQLRRKGPGSCGWLEEAAGNVLGGAAHRQIQGALLRRGLKAEEPMIPRALKTPSNVVTPGCAPAGTGFGRPDLSRGGFANMSFGEIKPWWRASTTGRLEAIHYQRRARQSKQRLFKLGQCGKQSAGPDDAAFWVSGVNEATGFGLLSGVVAKGENFGPFSMDPRKNLLAEERGPGAIGYWCALNAEGERIEEEKRERKRQEKAEKQKEKERKKQEREREKERKKREKEAKKETPEKKAEREKAEHEKAEHEKAQKEKAEKEKAEKEKAEKEKGGKGSGAAGNIGIGLSLGSSSIGGANAGVGISILSSSASVGTAGASVSVLSDSASAGAAGAGASFNDTGASALAAGTSASHDSTSVSVAAAGAGTSADTDAAGAGVASLGHSKDTEGAAAGVASKGDTSDSTAAVAGATGSRDVSGAVGASTGSPAPSVDPKDVTGPGADQVPAGQSDAEVMAKSHSKPAQGGAGVPGGTQPTGALSPGGARPDGTQQAGAGAGAGAGTRAAAGTGAHADHGPGTAGGGTGTGQHEPAASGQGSAAATSLASSAPGGHPRGTVPGATGPSPTAASGTGGPTTQVGGTAQGGGTGHPGGTATRPPGLPGGLAVRPVVPATASAAERERIDAEAGKVAALLQHAQDAQRLLLAYLASRSSDKQYLVPTSEWVAKMLKATEGMSNQDIEYLKQLDWKPGHITARELRERLLKALANRTHSTGSTSAAAAGKGNGAHGNGRQGSGDGAGPAAGGTRHGKTKDPASSGSDRATAPPPDVKHTATGTHFAFLIRSGISAARHLKPGEEVLCAVRILDLPTERIFDLTGVPVTFDGRKDASTILVHFTHDIWSEKFHFHGLGGKANVYEYSFGRAPPKKP